MDATRSLIEAAGSALRRTPPNNDDHVVAAAARSKDGRIFSGVNVSHFTGGPCAELVVLGVAVLQGVLAKDLECMVAVKADKKDGQAGISQAIKVLNPCGRCRQTMLDYNSDITVVVVDEKGSQSVVGIRELLPWAYVYPKEQE